jgi:hypothetical protein
MGENKQTQQYWRETQVVEPGNWSRERRLLMWLGRVPAFDEFERRRTFFLGEKGECLSPGLRLFCPILGFMLGGLSPYT